MKNNGRVCFVAVALSLGLGCSSGNDTGTHDITFMGAVIDGATGMPITGYSINLVYGSHTVKGKVDSMTGRFVLGPFPAWNDYGILIDAGTGYRAFSSYNAAIPPPAPPTTSLSADIYKSNTSQTFDFDAVLFPSGITPASVDVVVTQTDAMTTIPAPAKPAGSYRLQPTTLQPSIQAQASEVGGQVWSNDNDLFAAVVSDVFSEGTFHVGGSRLLYGVNYQITVYGVDNYQPGTGTVAAGTSLGATILISPETVLPLMLQMSTASMCTATQSLTNAITGQVTLTFNQSVEDGTTTAGGAKEAFDNVTNASTYYGYSPHPNVSSTVQERGTSFIINGSTVTMSYNPMAGITSTITGDYLYSLSYGSLGLGLSAISLQPVGHPSQKTSLSTLLGLNLITCTVTP